MFSTRGGVRLLLGESDFTREKKLSFLESFGSEYFFPELERLRVRRMRGLSDIKKNHPFAVFTTLLKFETQQRKLQCVRAKNL